MREGQEVLEDSETYLEEVSRCGVQVMANHGGGGVGNVYDGQWTFVLAACLPYAVVSHLALGHDCELNVTDRGCGKRARPLDGSVASALAACTTVQYLTPPYGTALDRWSVLDVSSCVLCSSGAQTMVQMHEYVCM